MLDLTCHLLIKYMKIKLVYFNEIWNVYLYTDNRNWMFQTPELLTIKDEIEGHEGEYRVRKYAHPEIPIHTFGWMADNPKQRPGHGGEWSSNSITINKIFKTNLIEIAVDQLSCSVPITWLKELLGNKVQWETCPYYYGEKIVSVDGFKNKTMGEVVFDNLKINKNEK